MASGYFGWNEQNITAASAIEVKIGQGAKPGLGGTLLGSKVTAEIAEVRGVEPRHRRAFARRIFPISIPRPISRAGWPRSRR